MKLHGTVVGIQFDAGVSGFGFEGGTFAGVGFLANGKDYEQTFFGMYGYTYGVNPVSLIDILNPGVGGSGQVFWGVSHIDKEPTLETFAGSAKYFGVTANGIILNIGVSEHWTTFSVGAGFSPTGKLKTPFKPDTKTSTGSTGYGETYIYKFD